MGYLPRGNPGLGPGLIRPQVSQTSGVSQNRLKDQAQGFLWDQVWWGRAEGCG
jgi:hypothetical protein